MDVETAFLHRISAESRSRGVDWVIAALAEGPDAVLSHHAAAAHWGLQDDNRARIDITTPRKLHPRKNLRPHCAVLPRDERTVRDGIPTTTVPRTLLDLAAVLPRQAVQRAMTEADVLRLTDPLSLPDLIHRHPHARGIRKLRDHLPILTREELERRSTPSSKLPFSPARSSTPERGLRS